jgi:hypothetical protein
MLSGKNQAGTQPYALGTLLQAATYGMAVPTIYGCTLSPLLAIWTANLREGGSNKKFKNAKKNVTTYVENIDFLIGHNPILGVLQMWNNGGTIPLAFATQTFTGMGPWTITDSDFYFVIGASVEESYNVTFDDYGSAGPVTETGTYEVPLWNELMTGPDPVRNSGYRNFPYTYRWEPSYGATVQSDSIDIFNTPSIANPGQDARVTIYYAKFTAATSFQSPLVRNRLAFENVLGDGDEYTGNFLNTSTPLSTQQILYPMFAGCGSANIDLGSSGTIPQLQAETMGKWGLYSSGDGDFADMIEDIFKSGLAQAAIGASSGTSPTTRVEHGLSCYNFPGCVQMKCSNAAGAGAPPQTYNMQVTEGNFLVVIGVCNGTPSAALTISDSASNSWTPVFASNSRNQVWYAQANATAPVIVTISGLGTNWTTTLIEVAGVDTFDSVSLGVDGVASIATTNAQNFPGYLLSIGLYAGYSQSVTPNPEIPLWTLLTPANYYGAYPAPGVSIQEMGIESPTSQTLDLPDASGITGQCILAFKATTPPVYPDPVGDFMDFASLDTVRLQCRANSLMGSLSMSSQQAASDYLTTLGQAADLAYVFAGFKLFSMPLSEISAVGNGAIYNSPTAGGPLYNLSTENGDFVATGSTPPIQLATADRVDQDNVLQMQCLNRTSNYNPTVVSQPDQGSIAVYGIRKGDPIQNYAVQDVSVARQLLGIAVRKLQYGGDVYTFTLPAKWCLLAPYGAGGGGNFAPTPPLNQIPGLAPLGLGESAVFLSANFNSQGTMLSGVSHLPPPDYAIFLNVFPAPTKCVFDSVPGFLFLPSAVVQWGAYQLPKGIDPSTVTHVYPFFVCVYGGADFTVSCPTNGWTGPGSVGPILGTDILPSIGGDASRIGEIVLQANYAASVPRDRVTSSVALVVLIVTYNGLGPSSPSGVFTSGSPTIADAVITITDPLANINKVPVRITSMVEQSDGSLQCTAEPFIYGMYAPNPYVVDQPAPFTPATNSSAGSVNVPVIFESTPRLSGQSTQPQLWAVISSGNAEYGGCQPYISTDGGSSYTPIGDPLIGSAITGVSTGDWPAHADPDTTNNLPLNLTESNGALQSYSATARDNFQYPCYIAGGGAFTIPYELFTYNLATLTTAFNYTLAATGSGNELRRGVYAAPSPAVGVDHPNGSRFAFLNPSGQGIMKAPMDPAWIGTTLFFKFPTFNNFGGAIQSLADATAYSYTPTGIPGSIGPATGGILVNGS